MLKTFFKRLILLGIALATFGMAFVIAVYSYFAVDLPNVKSLENVTLEQPLRVYDRNGVLLSDYGNELRHPISIDKFPLYLREAVVAIEDRRFYEHKGVDPIGIIRAGFILITTGHKSQGASTITQQVARNFFLNNKKEFVRKIREIILAIHMNQVLTKDEVLELYMNKIYLGYRSYGFVAAAKTYFNKNVQDLTLSESALLAGIQQSPSRINPITNLNAAIKRRNLVLAAMLDNKYITEEQYQQALAEKVIVNPGNKNNRTGYISELVRQALYEKYGDAIYTSGIKVYTTIDAKVQASAIQAVRNNLLNYTRRHGFKGPVASLFSGTSSPYSNAQLQIQLSKFPVYNPIYPVVVLSTSPTQAVCLKADGNQITLDKNSIDWAARYKDVDTKGPLPSSVNSVLKPGDVVYVSSEFGANFQIVSKLQQVPEVNSGLVSIDSQTGAIQALVGGFSYNRSLYNRATQAQVQVGSTIKPFVYAAGLENGLTLGTIVDDVPIAIKLPNGDIWRPANYGNDYAGAITIRQALAQSRNVIAVKVARELGLSNLADYLLRFGFAKDEITVTNSLALGAVNFTPIEMARAYATFDNGGFLVNPYLISRIEDSQGHVIYKMVPKIACSDDSAFCKSIPSIYSTKGQGLSNSNLTRFQLDSSNTNGMVDLKGINSNDTNSAEVDKLNADVDKDGIKQDTKSVNSEQDSSKTDQIFNLANNDVDGSQDSSNPYDKYAPRVLPPAIAWLIHNALETDVWGGPGYTGTGRRLQVLGRHDIGGKTGTTNDSRTAWFVGYAGPYVTAVYTAFDNNNPLGKHEQGALTALPAWLSFEKVQLKGVPLYQIPIPNNLVMTKINPQTGLLDVNGYTEYFISGTQPTQVQPESSSGGSDYQFVPTLLPGQQVKGNTYSSDPSKNVTTNQNKRYKLPSNQPNPNTPAQPNQPAQPGQPAQPSQPGQTPPPPAPPKTTNKNDIF